MPLLVTKRGDRQAAGFQTFYNALPEPARGEVMEIREERVENSK
jgi:hypothetical protein